MFAGMIFPRRDERDKGQEHKNRPGKQQRMRRKIFRKSVLINELPAPFDDGIGDKRRYDHGDQNEEQYPDTLELAS